MDNSLMIAMILMIAVYYFLLIRPQQQRMKRHKEMIANLKKGDRVVTQGGIIGKVTTVKGDDTEIELEIASGVKVTVIKSTSQNLVSKTEPQA